MNNVNKLGYAFYSRLLNEAFDSVEDLVAAEEAYKAKQKAKEDKAAAKKADAKKVENAFKAMNSARKQYKQSLLELTEKYAADLKAVKEAFENDKTKVSKMLADSEAAYASTLKDFTEKYPEGFHLTLKDGDFETTISSNTMNKKSLKHQDVDMFDLFYSIFHF